MKNILLLGKGYIGSSLSDYLVSKSDIKSNIYSKKDLNYLDFNTLNKYLQQNQSIKIDYIINCAGYTGRPNVEGCENDKETCWKYNVKLPIVLTEIASYWNIPIIHISSGCVYTGYEKDFSEDDEPNFGIHNKDSSFYSKTKHACELSLKNSNSYILRIRMPFSYKSSERNYIDKILKYDNLISYKNSLTNIDDLNEFIYKFISLENKPEYGIYNVTNQGYATAKQIVEILKKYNLQNKNWKFLDQNQMNFKVSRSNCVLSTEKIKKLNLELPNIYYSMENSIKNYDNLHTI
jgi:dTDP-4-dehydrorhamnose reductase